MVLHVVGSVTTDAATVKISNTASAPVFYAVLTTTFDGRFGHNLLYVRAKSSRTVSFAFEANATASGVPSSAQFESSLSVEWLNKGGTNVV